MELLDGGFHRVAARRQNHLAAAESASSNPHPRYRYRGTTCTATRGPSRLLPAPASTLPRNRRRPSEAQTIETTIRPCRQYYRQPISACACIAVIQRSKFLPPPSSASPAGLAVIRAAAPTPDARTSRSEHPVERNALCVRGARAARPSGCRQAAEKIESRAALSRGLEWLAGFVASSQGERSELGGCCWRCPVPAR